MQQNKGFIGLGTLLALMLVVVIAGSGAYYAKSKRSSQSDQTLQTAHDPDAGSQEEAPDVPSTTVTAKAENGYQGVFAASPSEGGAPLTVKFNSTIESAGDISIEYGDGASCSTANPGGDQPCPVFTHTYAKPGSYTARLYRHLPTTELARLQISVKDKREAPYTVSGMSAYTDEEFGFSFWYPTAWKVDSLTTSGSNTEDCVFKKSFSVHGSDLSNGVTVIEYYCPNRSITLRGLNGTNPVGMDFKYYFDTNTHTWMVSYLSDPPNGSPRTTSAANVSNNTMGGLHIFSGAARFGADVVVPLSAKNFLIISTNDGGGYVDERLFAKTIVATDPSVATPVSKAEQIDIIEAERDGYAQVQNEHAGLTAAPVAGATWEFFIAGSFATQQDSYLIDYGDGSKEESLTCASASATEPLCFQFKPMTHTFPQTGYYKVRVVANFRGLGSNSTTELLSARIYAAAP
jgi:hypothetical protein